MWLTIATINQSTLNPHPIQTLSICTSTASKTARHKHCNGIDTACHRRWLDQGFSESDGSRGELSWAAFWKNHKKGTIALERVREQKQIVFQQKVVVSKNQLLERGNCSYCCSVYTWYMGLATAGHPFFIGLGCLEDHAS